MADVDVTRGALRAGALAPPLGVGFEPGGFPRYQPGAAWGRSIFNDVVTVYGDFSSGGFYTHLTVHLAASMTGGTPGPYGNGNGSATVSLWGYFPGEYTFTYEQEAGTTARLDAYLDLPSFWLSPRDPTKPNEATFQLVAQLTVDASNLDPASKRMSEADLRPY